MTPEQLAKLVIEHLPRGNTIKDEEMDFWAEFIIYIHRASLAHEFFSTVTMMDTGVAVELGLRIIQDRAKELN